MLARTRIAVPMAAALSGLMLAGCGGKPVTRADVIARGNAICATAARQLADLPARGGTLDFTRAAPIVAREAKALAALPRPAARRALLVRFLAAESALARGYRHLAALQRAGDGAAVQGGVQAIASSDAGTLARRYGLAQCGAASATVR